MGVELWFIYTTHRLTQGNICDKFFENPSYRYRYFKKKGTYLSENTKIGEIANGERYFELNVEETTSKKKGGKGCCGPKGSKCTIF